LHGTKKNCLFPQYKAQPLNTTAIVGVALNNQLSTFVWSSEGDV